MKKKFILVLSLLFAFILSSCEWSDIALAEIIRKSQPRDDIRWSNAYVVPNTTTNTKVDAAIFLSARGVHTFYNKQENGEIIQVGSKSTPTLKNDKKTGLYRGVYIPSNYNSSSSPYVMLGLIDPGRGSDTKYYAYNIKESDTTQCLTELAIDTSSLTGKFDPIGDKFGLQRSSSLGSKRVFFRLKDSDKYVYYIGDIKLDITTKKFSFENVKMFEDKFENKRRVNKIWESPNGSYAVVMYTKNEINDNKYSQRYATVELSSSSSSLNTLVPISQLNEDGSTSGRNLYFDHFIVYDEKGKRDSEQGGSERIVWMGILRSGIIYHSHSTKDTLKTDDGSFNLYYYAPVASLNVTNADEDNNNGKYGCCLFARYTGNGFIVARFLKMVNGSNHVVQDYKDSNGKTWANSYVVTNKFAENLRSEDISEFAYFNGSSDSSFKGSLVVLTTEVGLSTYILPESTPHKIIEASEEKRDIVDLPFN